MKFAVFVNLSLQIISFRWNMDVSDFNFISSLLELKQIRKRDNLFTQHLCESLIWLIMIQKVTQRLSFCHPQSPRFFRIGQGQRGRKNNKDNKLIESLCPQCPKCTNDALGPITLFLCQFDLSINNTDHGAGALLALPLSTEKRLKSPFY